MNVPVSIVMPVHNGGAFLSEAIESILGQTFGDFEFIIVDDGSTDNSLAIALGYQKKDSRIEIDRHEENKGIVAARNSGLARARGKYIAWIDSDDVSLPERIEKQFSFMEGNPAVGVSGANALLIDERGRVISGTRMPETHVMIAWGLCFYDPIVNSAVMASREVCRRAGGYRDLAADRAEYFPEDYDLWTRLSHRTQLHNSQEYLVKLRKHAGNITRTRLESTLRNSSRICSTYLRSILASDIPQTVVDTLWGVGSSPSLRGIPELLENLCSHFSTWGGSSEQEKTLIRRDASLRLVRMAMKHPFDAYCLPSLLMALKIEPKLPRYLLGEIFRKPRGSREGAWEEGSL
jgi:glycosyltransferase involved in cell wall biosynthesis